jgi:hypothetical protein
MQYADIHLEKPPLKSAITENAFFQFDDVEITNMLHQFGMLLDQLYDLLHLTKEPNSDKEPNIAVVTPYSDSHMGNATTEASILPQSMKHNVRDSFKTSFYNELQEQLA